MSNKMREPDSNQTQCCVCYRVKNSDGNWRAAEHAPGYSHGYCPTCLKKTLEELPKQRGLAEKVLARLKR